MQRRSILIRFAVGLALLAVLGYLAFVNLIAWPAAAALALFSLPGLYLIATRRGLEVVSIWVGLALFPAYGLALLVILFVILPSVTLQTQGLQAAALAGTVIAAGWVTTFIASEYRRADERETTRIDALNALETEIFSILEKLDYAEFEQAAQKVQEKIATGGDRSNDTVDLRYFPFVATESAPTIFEAISDRIVVLQPKTLQVVVRFYAAYSDLRAMVSDHRSADFRQLDAARRINAHQALTAQRRATFYWGIRALVQVNTALKRPERTRASRFVNAELAEKAIRHQKEKQR